MEEVLAELGENVASRHDLVSPDSGGLNALEHLKVRFQLALGLKF